MVFMLIPVPLVMMVAIAGGFTTASGKRKKNMSFKKWQLKAIVYTLIIAIVPVRHNNEIQIFAQLMMGLFTGNVS